MFNILDVTNNGKNTFKEVTGLSLEQNTVYYVYVIGTDKTGQCAMNVTEFLVDITPPTMGIMKAGPYYDMVSRSRSFIFRVVCYIVSCELNRVVFL